MTELELPSQLVYVLKLENSKWYVGWSGRGINRVIDHFTKEGCDFTRANKPLECVKLFKGDQDDENRITREYMRKYGWQNVRGGKWSAPTLLEKPAELDEPEDTETEYIEVEQERKALPPTEMKDKCYSCGKPGHWTRNCPNNVACFRCGKEGHRSRDCTSPTITAPCLKCKQPGHYARDCPVFKNTKRQRTEE